MWQNFEVLGAIFKLVCTYIFSGGTNKVVKSYKAIGKVLVSYILVFGKYHLAVEAGMCIYIIILNMLILKQLIYFVCTCMYTER
jgi:hypothetical protein